jgi:hypothetical protein
LSFCTLDAQIIFFLQFFLEKISSAEDDLDNIMIPTPHHIHRETLQKLDNSGDI